MNTEKLPPRQMRRTSWDDGILKSSDANRYIYTLGIGCVWTAGFKRASFSRFKARLTYSDSFR